LGPTRSSVWERGARRVKDTRSRREPEHLAYIERICETHDPTLHLKTLEDELKSTIGQALRKQADKILQAVAEMERERETYLGFLRRAKHQTADAGESDKAPWLSRLCPETRLELEEVAARHNQHRTRAIHSRWELIVHRQAAGFLVNNHNVVTQTFPIGKALPTCWEELEAASDVHDLVSMQAVSSNLVQTTKQTEASPRIPDQLDWWQRIGRWR
jgi:hypothetical protein